jgi:hypothetical protein
MKFQVFAVFERRQMPYNQKNRTECGRVAQLGESTWLQSSGVLSNGSFPLSWFPMFSTIRGICFSLKRNPNAMKTLDSCTVRSTVAQLLLGQGVEKYDFFRSKCALRNCPTPGFTHKLNPSLRQRCASQPRSKGGVALPLLYIYLPKKVIIAPVEARESAWA